MTLKIPMQIIRWLHFIFSEATDADGTEPGNVVKYEVDARSDKATEYFKIDPESGVITLLGDLTMEVYEEYKLEVKAHDLGMY